MDAGAWRAMAAPSWGRGRYFFWWLAVLVALMFPACAQAGDRACSMGVAHQCAGASGSPVSSTTCQGGSGTSPSGSGAPGAGGARTAAAGTTASAGDEPVCGAAASGAAASSSSERTTSSGSSVGATNATPIVSSGNSSSPSSVGGAGAAAGNAQAPVSTVQAPVSTVQAPADTVQAPVSTAEAPVSTAEAPVSTTEAPADTAQAPVSTSRAAGSNVAKAHPRSPSGSGASREATASVTVVAPGPAAVAGVPLLGTVTLPGPVTAGTEAATWRAPASAVSATAGLANAISPSGPVTSPGSASPVYSRVARRYASAVASVFQQVQSLEEQLYAERALSPVLAVLITSFESLGTGGLRHEAIPLPSPLAKSIPSVAPLVARIISLRRVLAHLARVDPSVTLRLARTLRLLIDLLRLHARVAVPADAGQVRLDGLPAGADPPPWLKALEGIMAGGAARETVAPVTLSTLGAPSPEGSDELSAGPTPPTLSSASGRHSFAFSTSGRSIGRMIALVLDGTLIGTSTGAASAGGSAAPSGGSPAPSGGAAAGSLVAFAAQSVRDALLPGLLLLGVLAWQSALLAHRLERPG